VQGKGDGEDDCGAAKTQRNASVEEGGNQAGGEKKYGCDGQGGGKLAGDLGVRGLS
jgi:hypothetical protein